MVCGLAYSWTMKTSRRGSVAAIVRNLLCGGHYSGSADRLGLGVPRLDVAPRDEDGRSWEEVKLEIVQRAVWGML